MCKGKGKDEQGKVVIDHFDGVGVVPLRDH